MRRLAAAWQGLRAWLQPYWARLPVWLKVVLVWPLFTGVGLLGLYAVIFGLILWESLPLWLRCTTVFLGITAVWRGLHVETPADQARRAFQAAAKADAEREALPLSPVPDTVEALRLLWDDPSD